MTETDIAIHLRGLTRRFGDVVAVDDLSLVVHRGEVFGFLGHNGAGKTTTVRLLNGVLDPSAGGATVLGLDPWADGVALRRRTGVLTEQPALDPRLTARENLRYAGELYGLDRRRAAVRARELIAAFGLAGRGGERVGGYSKGMKQRLALARALVHEPELLFLDEPTSALDPIAARAVHDRIRALARERRTILMCTHNLAEAQRLCDRVAVLRQGRRVAVGTAEELGRRIAPPGVEVEVTPATVAAAREALGAAFPAADVDASGETVLTITGVASGTVPRLVATLVDAGVGVRRVQPTAPDLEEVYFALADRRMEGEVEAEPSPAGGRGVS